MLRKILESPVSTPKEMLYLELGVLPIGFILRMRRLNFLKYILDEDENSLIHTFLKAQLEDPTPNDWGQSCLQDLEVLDLKVTVADIKAMPKSTFRNLVKKQTNKNGLEYLNQEKEKHSKVAHISHSCLEIQNYLELQKLSVQEAKFLFALRSRMLEVKGNYRGKHKDIICPCCKLEEDHQHHLLVCSKLNTVSE